MFLSQGVDPSWSGLPDSLFSRKGPFLKYTKTLHQRISKRRVSLSPCERGKKLNTNER